MSKQNFNKKNFIFGLVAGVVIIGAVGLAIMFVGGYKNKTITIDAAKAKTIEYINANLMQGGQKATIKEASEDGELYKMVVVLPNGQEINSYVTKDGTKFFPQVMDMGDSMAKNNQDKNASKPVATVKTKKDKPEVELFVMSYCPYGTQIEKGILPVLDTLGNKVNFKLKFVDYAMHGKKEIDQNLIQYCIQKNEPEKLLSYLRCFLEDEKSDECLTKTQVNQSQLQSCTSSTDKEFKVSELYADKSTWSGGRYPQFNIYKDDNNKYGVQGSPTLVINGSKIQSGRDSSNLLKTICSGFNNPPAECNKKLSSTPPAPGFGFKTDNSNSKGGSSNSGGSCGN